MEEHTIKQHVEYMGQLAKDLIDAGHPLVAKDVLTVLYDLVIISAK